MRRFSKLLCMVLSMALLVGMVPAIASTASAEGTTYQLATLLTEGRIKPLGRTAVNPDSTGIMCDWPGNGFQMNVSGNGGTLEIVVSTNYAANWVVLVDDEQVYWERLSSTGGTISATIPAGDHLVSVIKESDNQGKETDYCDLTTMTFDGTIAECPADKELVIEFVGDSYSAGWGTLGTYKPGRSWPATEHSFIHSYSYLTAQKLNADYMIAARGGIGLFDGVSAEQPDDDPEATILDIYPYTAGFRKSAGLYQFDRQADIIILELGANDTIKETDANFTAAKWKEAMEQMVDMARAGNPNAAIVLLSHKAVMFDIDREIVEARKETDPNLYYFSYAHQGNGSGGSTQYYGHPNIEDNVHWADALTAFLEERGLTGATTAEPQYNDYVYYASETGSTTADGTTEATAMLSIKGALDQAAADRTYTEGDRIVVNVTGTVGFVDTVSKNQDLASTSLLTASGKKVPVLIQTNNYTGTKAAVDTYHSTTSANSHLVYLGNDITFKNIIFQSTTHVSGDVATRDYRLYAGYNDIVFDNVTFAQVGDTPTTENNTWQLSAGHILGTTTRPETATSSTLTFKNGDYTNVGIVTNALPNSLTGSVTSAPTIHTKIIIEDGAKMGTVYNRYGTMNYGSTGVYVKGGSIAKYIGTQDGTSSAYKTYTGDINFVMTGGDIGGNEFNAVGRYVTVKGDINNTVSGGIIEIRPTADYNAINFGGRLSTTVENVTNNISGGMFLNVCDNVKSDSSNIISGYYLGGLSNATINGKVTNNISGGSFVPMNGTCTFGHSSLYFGVLSGKIGGGLYNNLTGGTFDMSATSGGGYYFGAYTNATPIARIVNVFGEKDGWKGPVFKGAYLNLAGRAGAIGASATVSALPAVTDCSDSVVISNTFYNGYYSSTIYAGPVIAESSTAFNFVQGSIETNVYGGQLQGTFYGAGTTDVYGKVTVNLKGGHVSNVYAGGNTATVYDGVELNICEGFQEYHDVLKTNAWHFWGGTYGVDLPAPQTAGRDSIKITVNAETPSNLVLKTPIEASCRSTYTVGGTVSMQVNGGTFPEGFTPGNMTVNAALADGFVYVDTTTGTKLTYADTDTTTGDTSVTVIAEADVQEPVIPDAYIATVKNGQITTYATTVSEMTSAIAASGNSVITLYDDITTSSAITLPYSCTMDFNGHTVTTNPTSGNGIIISAAGTQNQTTTVKNGTLLHFEIGIRVNAGAIVVENMTIRSNQGAPIGIYDPTDYTAINRVTNSFLSSALTGCIAFNKDGVDFSGTGITIESSTLVSHKRTATTTGYSTAAVWLKRAGATAAGTVTLGKNVQVYTYNSSYGSIPTAGETLTASTSETVQVGDTTFEGMNKWTTPISAIIDPTTGTGYDSLSEAMTALEETGGTLRLQEDMEASVVTVRSGITLDLNGKTVDTRYFTCYGSMTDGSAGGNALVKATNIHIAGQDSYLPIYDSANEGYRFYKYELQNLGARTVEGDTNAVKFGFRLVLSNTDGYDVLSATTDEALDTFAYISWGNMAAPITYQFRDDTLRSYAALAMADIAASGSTAKAITITLTGTDSLEAGTKISLYDTMVSAPGVTAQSDSAVWTVQ